MGLFSRRSTKPVFRGAEYYKSVWVGKRTVKDGECASVWGMDGRAREVEGPRLLWVCFSQVRFLERFCADQSQYLRVQHRDGSVEHITGPIALFLNPVKHQNIKVCQAEVLDATDVMMIYTDPDPNRSPASPLQGFMHTADKPQTSNPMAESVNATPNAEHQSMVTRIVRGPAVFVPSAHERLLSFTWTHAADEPPLSEGDATTRTTARGK
eukprot:CAMPEP_0173379760 /NCGR_PEP_ID=MMETSP1356-20130122/2583_1 /TAXON_ID=77927 ORGANISM="Hemiselmis virescens, Strain PCC157" /NCGR_SAMPLE_ID=MMETSP1356 /ASSEMBLY_ACC=CAM_ASM_000847 /LENGTH=210 /DNA_ID=CAMNT_0014333157 /DNA_START=184 /DNA_END=813 /DNA_ORIENTATION=-